MTKFFAILAALIVSSMIAGTLIYTQFQPELNNCDASSTAGAKIGGSFELVDANAVSVLNTDIIDGPTLIYFGYTFCPDVCPLDLARNIAAVDLLTTMGHEVTPVFISIDPERDTPEVLADYQLNMHPNLKALTGSLEQVSAAAAAFKVYFARGSGDDEYYLMDHSTFSYLMFPENRLAAHFKREDSAEDIASKTACLIDNH